MSGQPTPSVARRYVAGQPALAAMTVAMLITLGVAIVGLWVDPRIITGAPAWLKPAKFALSAGLYGATLVLLLEQLPEWPRLRRAIARTTVVVFVLEVALVVLQVWRGQTSHFNVSTPFDAAVFSVMGAAIVVQTLVSAAAIPALWRHRFEDPAFGAAWRAAMVLTVAGAFSGALMTTPTAAQMQHVRATGAMPVSGAHTVGAPDGGPGLLGTGWSRDHGDLRIPHFVGLHALQVLPLVALLLRRVSRDRRLALVRLASTSYGALFVILLAGALAGRPLIAPGPTFGPLLAAWAVLTSCAAWWIAARRESRLALSSAATA